MPKVIVQFGGDEWSVELREGVNVVGRSPQAGIAIKDPSMSREHCDIVLEGGFVTVVDRGSMNGTLVNGTRLERKVLSTGDKIQVGKAVVYFEDKRGLTAPSEPEAHVVGIDDYSVWRRESGGMVKGVIALAALGALAVCAVLIFKSLGPGTTPAAEPGNLIGTSGRFDPGPVIGWSMKSGQVSRLQVIEGAAKEGKGCLQVEKSGAPSDLVAEVQHAEILAPPPSGVVEVSTWVRSESPNLLPALKVAWLAGRKGPILYEESSEPAALPSSWTHISRTFSPPPGAAAFQLSLVAVGRAGRISFDDVRVRAGSGGAAAKSADLGGHSVTASPAGVLNVAQDARRILGNLQVFLGTEKDGAIPQFAAAGGRVEVDDAGKRITAAGRLASPVDLRPVEFEIEARAGATGPQFGYRLRGDALKQIERVGVTLLLPDADLKGEYTNPVSRLWFRGSAGDFILEISEGLMRVTADWVPGARRVVLGVPIPRGASEAAFGFILKAGAGGMADPRVRANDLEKQGKPSEALDVWKDLLTATREEAKRAEILAVIKRLEELEAEDWKAVQAQGFRAALIGLKPYYEEALVKLDQYERRWPGGKRAEAARAERATLTSGFGSAAEDRETVRAHRLVDRAEELRKEGRKRLARELCESVRRHYGSSTAAARAAELLKSLGLE